MLPSDASNKALCCVTRPYTGGGLFKMLKSIVRFRTAYFFAVLSFRTGVYNIWQSYML